MKPLLLDLFCGAGGSAKGYTDAGFQVVGVDISPQPNYPYQFIRADAMRVLRDPHVTGLADVIHASPPCQAYSSTRTMHSNQYPDLIPAVRSALDEIGKPYVIENVQYAPLRHDVMLCGVQFGLHVIRHRFFELGGWTMENPPHVKHQGNVRGYNHGSHKDGIYLPVYGKGGGKGNIQEWRDAMGVDWPMTQAEIAESIPPLYTKCIGDALRAYLTGDSAPGGIVTPPGT